MENSFDILGCESSKRGFSKTFVYIVGVLLAGAFITNYFSNAKGSNQNPSKLEKISNSEFIVEKESNLIGPYIFEKQLNNPKTYHVNPFNYEVKNGK